MSKFFAAGLWREKAAWTKLRRSKFSFRNYLLVTKECIVKPRVGIAIGYSNRNKPILVFDPNEIGIKQFY